MTLPDLSMMKLGRKAVKRDSRTLRMSAYFTSALPPAPPSVDWTKGLSTFGMMLNDQHGCCTIAGIGHAIQIFTHCCGKAPVTVPDSTVLEYYEKWDGYNPLDPTTDQGGIELDVLNAWRASDFSGHKLAAYVSVTPHITQHVKQGMNLFGGLYIGISLPNTAQTQTVWDLPTGQFDPNDALPDSWGGHCVFAVGYDADGVTVVTWGALKKMTWAFWNTYVDEAYCLLSPDFLNESGASPLGFNFTQLQTDLAQIN